MNRLLILLFSIFLIGCCNESKLLNNGLTQKATQITEYTMKVENDSLNNQIQDTLVITEKKYNENDQIISRHQRNLFANETMDILKLNDTDFKQLASFIEKGKIVTIVTSETTIKFLAIKAFLSLILKTIISPKHNIRANNVIVLRIPNTRLSAIAKGGTYKAFIDGRFTKPKFLIKTNSRNIGYFNV